MGENDINQDRFQARLTKELRIKGSMPAPVLAPEIVPVLIIEGERAENLHLQREHRFACSLTLAAVAAEHYYFQLWNPAGRGGIVVVEEFGIATLAAADSFDFGFAWAALAPALRPERASYCLDSRVPGRAPRVGVGEPLVGSDAAAGNIDVFGRVRCVQNVTHVTRPSLVLTPGFGFSIWDITQNVGVQGYCIWRERQMQPGEFD